MKHSLFFTITLLISATPYHLLSADNGPQKIEHPHHRRKFIKLTHWAIRLVDGIPGAIDENALLDSLQTRNFINKLLKGTPDAKTKTYIKDYTLDGKKVSLNDLVKIEQEAIKQNPNNPALSDEFKACLSKMKLDFKIFTKPLLDNAEEARETNMKLIKQWAHLAGRLKSLLLHWGAIDEDATLKAASAEEFHDFCVDLKEFLHDLMYSCPKAREFFKKAFLPEHEWAKFDKAFEEI
ncbi:hypothetical protein K9K77_03285 [Candidatus Babeliales bacterium]|nr:hypothetical protein [Candidatus Babeliales bacterium]